jgi:hypothetical protein
LIDETCQQTAIFGFDERLDFHLILILANLNYAHLGQKVALINRQ